MTQSSGEALCSTRTISWSLNFGNRDTGTIVEIGSSVIRKQYTGSDRSSRVAHLNRIYRWMQERSVPNVDRMVSCRNDDSVSIVYLGPRGVNAPPSSPTEVREAVVCVLEALVACLFTIHFRFLLYLDNSHHRSYIPTPIRYFTETYVGLISFETLT